MTIDITGHKYGKLTVLKKNGLYISPSGFKAQKWDCICDCGNQVNLISGVLRSGATKSCGCLKAGKYPDGLNETSLFKVWMSIKARCYNQNSRNYKHYGGRGIRVCDRWLDSFEYFYADMGERPKGHSIDRIDNNGNYELSNCRWASSKVQTRNKRNNRFYEFNGEIMCIIDWEKRLGLSNGTLAYRLKNWTLEKALTTKKELSL